MIVNLSTRDPRRYLDPSSALDGTKGTGWLDHTSGCLCCIRLAVLCGALARRRHEGPGGGGGCEAAAMLPFRRASSPEQGGVCHSCGASGLGMGEGRGIWFGGSVG